MKKYRFPFDAVERVRKLERDQQRMRLAESFRAEDIVRNERERLEKERSLVRDRQRLAATRSELEVNDMLAAQRYELVLQSQSQALEKQAALLTEAIERRQLAVVEAEREVQMMEKLDRRLRKSHELKEGRDEIKQLDEIAQQRAANRNRK